jgi:hypothetical protein
MYVDIDSVDQQTHPVQCSANMNVSAMGLANMRYGRFDSVICAQLEHMLFETFTVHLHCGKE